MFPLDHIPVNIRPFFIHPVRTVRSIGGDVEKKGIVLVFLHETDRLLEEDIGAIPGKFFQSCFAVTVAFVGIVKVIISVMVGCLPDPSAFVPDHILKPFVLRTAGSIVPEVPFSHHSGLVASFGKVLSNGDFVVVQIAPPAGCTVCTRTGGVPAGHQRCPGGGAKRADMEIGQADGLGMKLIKVGCLNDRISVAGEITVALVISHEDDNIWPFSSRKEYGQKEEKD